MRPADTPFSTGWLGSDLCGARPDASTYGCYPYEKLPALPFQLRGDFAWLHPQRQHNDSIANEKSLENAEVLTALLKDASQRKLTLPAEFVAFLSNPEIQQRVRSCTDCFLDLTPICVPFPVANGFLVRFLADSQGCIFWYLYLVPDCSEHCIVASPDYYGAEAELLQDEPPDPEKIVFCEETFERFMCRFWLENEIWYSEHEKRSQSPEARRYLEAYARSE